eukprot:scaffold37751_cov18-Tisochrysis_lutea.AAC.1
MATVCDVDRDVMWTDEKRAETCLEYAGTCKDWPQCVIKTKLLIASLTVQALARQRATRAFQPVLAARQGLLSAHPGRVQATQGANTALSVHGEAAKELHACREGVPFALAPRSHSCACQSLPIGSC